MAARAARLARAFLILTYLFDVPCETTTWNDQIWSPRCGGCRQARFEVKFAYVDSGEEAGRFILQFSATLEWINTEPNLTAFDT